jgi:hypothetical protein
MNNPTQSEKILQENIHFFDAYTFERHELVKLVETIRLDAAKSALELALKMHEETPPSEHYEQSQKLSTLANDPQLLEKLNK